MTRQEGQRGTVSWIVFRKELKETLRDRRTLTIMVAVPVLLYPLMLIASEQLSLAGIRRLQAEPSRVAVQGPVPADLERVLRTEPSLELVDLAGRPDEALRTEQLHAVAVLGPEVEESGQREILVYFDAANDRSRLGRDALASAFRRWGDTLLTRRLSGQGLPPSFAAPLAIADSSVALPEELGGYTLGRFLPLVLIVITLLGTFYPAIDLAAGEKERGTLETLLTAPVPAKQIVTGKFLTVAVVGVVTAALNLGSMLLTFQTGLFRLGAAIDVEFSLPWSSIAIVFATLVPLAILFGSLFLGIAVRARSFKEAQNALTPVYMIAILPAFLPLFPGIDFTPALALVPIAGVALFFRELMAGALDPVMGGLALWSTVVYAWTALLFAGRSFGREEVLFGGESKDPLSEGMRLRDVVRDFFRPGVRPDSARRRRTPGFGGALFFLGTVAVLYFYLGVRLQVRWLEQGLFASEWLLLFLPAVLYVLTSRNDAVPTFSLRRPRAQHVLGGLLMVAGGMPLGWFLAWMQSFILPIPWDVVQGLTELISADSVGRVLWLLVLVAVTPAICEEAVFRGVLLAGSRKRFGVWGVVLLNAVLFGAFHVSSETIFRFLPTAWLGAIMAWVVYHTRSIWVSSLMHFVNNGTIVLILAVPAVQTWISRWEASPPLPLLPLAAIVFLIGARTVARGGPAGEQPESRSTEGPEPRVGAASAPAGATGSD